MPSVVIHGTQYDSQRAERIAAAIACIASLRFDKRVLVLPMTLNYNITDILIGSKIKQNAIRSRGYSFDDTGLDALLRRYEQGNLTAETFVDCCTALNTKNVDFHIATNSKRQDLDTYIAQNGIFIRKFIEAANKLYDLVIILADAKEKEALKVLENAADQEITVIPQGNYLDVQARKDTIYVINNYDQLSIYNFKKMKNIYSISNEKKIYPVSYNIGFKDACRSENAIDYFNANNIPDKEDINYVFINDIRSIVSVILGSEEPVIKEKKFVQKERPSKRK